MKRSRNILLVFLSFFLLHAGPIKEDDPRINDIKKGLNQNEFFPSTMKLFYKGRKDDYTIFYDMDGNEAWYRYRRNKFDLDAEETIIHLIEGNPYEINGEFTGMLVYSTNEGMPIPVPRFTPKTKLTLEEQKAAHNIPVFKLIGFRSLLTESILF